MCESVDGRTEDVRTDAGSNPILLAPPEHLAQVRLQKQETSDRLMPNIKKASFQHKKDCT